MSSLVPVALLGDCGYILFISIRHHLLLLFPSLLPLLLRLLTRQK